MAKVLIPVTPQATAIENALTERGAYCYREVIDPKGGGFKQYLLNSSTDVVIHFDRDGEPSVYVTLTDSNENADTAAALKALKTPSVVFADEGNRERMQKALEALDTDNSPVM